MNHIYKVIFNKATGTFVAVGEYAKGQGKRSNRSTGSASKTTYKTSNTVLADLRFIKLSVITIGMLSGLGFSSQAMSADVVVDTKGVSIVDNVSNPTVVHSALTDEGLNNGGHKAINVAEGVEDTDAVNVAQLEKSKTHYYSVNDVGTPQGNYNNDGATGENSIAAGIGAYADHKNSIAIGTGSRAGKNTFAGSAGRDDWGVGAIAIGNNASSRSTDSIVIGNGASSSANSSGSAVVIGTGASAGRSGLNSVSIGTKASTFDHDSVSIGHLSQTGLYGAAVGSQAQSTGLRSAAIGPLSRATDRDTSALGPQAQATAQYATAVGSLSKSTALNSTSLGRVSSSNKVGAVAIGAYSKANRAVLSGASASDTPIISSNQVYSLATANQVDKDAISATVKGSYGAVSVGNTQNTRQIINVAAGSEDSDAVNVAQLKSVANTPMTFTGNTNSDTDALEGYVAGDGTQRNLGQAIEISGGATGASSNSNVKTVVTDGKVDIQLLDAPTFTGVVTGNGFNASGQKITNVANGTENTDAVNLSQLKAVDRDTYFHVMKADQSNAGTGDATTNLGKLDDAAGAIGKTSVAAGQNATASGDRGVAVGFTTNASGRNTTAVGYRASAQDKQGVAIGYRTESAGMGTTSVGSQSGRDTTGNVQTNIGALAGAYAGGYANTSIGGEAGSGTKANRNIGHDNVSVGYQSGTTVTGSWNTAVGSQSGRDVTGAQNTAIGRWAGQNVTGADNTTLGIRSGQNIEGSDNLALGTGAGSSIVGYSNIAIGEDAGVNLGAADNPISRTLSMGKSAKALSDGAIAIGAEATATEKSSVALGEDSIANTAQGMIGANPLNVAINDLAGNTWTSTRSAVSVGDVDNNITRQITDVAAGTNPTDAVNVAQLAANVSEVQSSDNVSVVRNDTPGHPIYTVTAEDTTMTSTKGRLKVTENLTDSIDGNAGIDNYDIDLSQDIIDAIAHQTSVIGDGPVSVTKTNTANATGGDEYQVSITTDDTITTTGDQLSVNTGIISNNNDGSTRADAPDTIATTGDVANAINNSGFTVKANGERGKMINPGDKVDFIDGKNIEITRDVGKFTFATKADVGFNNVTVGPVVINKDTGINAGDKKITNVATGIELTDAVNVSQLTTQTNASKEVVKNDDGSIEVVTTQDPNTNANIFDVSVNVDETTITKDADGNIKANTSSLSNKAAGTVKAPNAPKALATAGDVANAINNSGFTVKANGERGKMINPGDKVDFIDGKNIEITRDVGKFTFATKADVGFDNVTVGPVVINKDTGINAGDKKITNVAAGTELTDAVNVSQLGEAAAAAATKVKAGTNVADVVEETGDKGQTIYTVNAKGTTASSKSDALEVNAVEKDGNLTDYEIDLSAKTKDSLDKADRALQTVVTQIDGKEVKTINQGDNTANFVTGTNIKLDDVGQGDIKISTADNVIFTNVISHNMTVNNGDSIAQGGDVDYITEGNQSVVNGGDVYNAINTTIGDSEQQYTGDNGDVIIKRKPDQVLVFKGGATTSTENNIKTAANVDGSIAVKLAEKVDLGQNGSVKAGNTLVDANGITVTNPDLPDNVVTLTNQGLNNGGNTITNVGPGVNGTDAVNLNQLKDLGYSLNTKIDKVGDEANAGVSSAMAMASLPQAYLPGKSMLTGGMATYNGEGAVAVGLSKLSDNGRWVLKISGSADTEGNAGGAVGAGFHF